MLGSDITGTVAKVVNNPNGQESEQGLIDRSTTTQFLIAAGAPAFDPRCNNPDIDAALAAGCSAIGTFQSW